MGISQYVNRDQLSNVKDLQITFRRGLGAIIWVHQTRPDVGFLIAKIATDLVSACAESSNAILMGELYYKTVRF